MAKTHKKIDVAGLEISAVTKSEFLREAAVRIKARQKTFVVTPYSEFLYASMRRSDVRALLNSADFSLADGVGVLWANLFLSVPLTWPGFYLKILQAWLQVVLTGASILLYPKLIYTKGIPEKIVGANLIWDLAELAAKNNFKVYLLGSRRDNSKVAAKKLQEKYPVLKIVGTSNKNVNDPTIVEDINQVSPDMLLVTFDPIVQEQWIADHLNKTTAAFAIGLGGTFDYLAGEKKQPPQFIRNIGLEWLYRLITQPSRVFRIYRGFWGLILSAVRYKVYLTTPFRSNVSVVVRNNEGKVLVCKRSNIFERGLPVRDFTKDYWQFPQGGIDSDEDFLESAKRELQEETGIVSVKFLGQAKFRNTYVWNNATRPLMFTRKRYMHKGQDQLTVFFSFFGKDNEIKLDQRELNDFKWLNPREVVKIMAPERRPHAEAVLAELTEIPL